MSVLRYAYHSVYHFHTIFFLNLARTIVIPPPMPKAA